MRITAIFGSADLAESAARAVSRQIEVLGRRIIPLEGLETTPYTEQPPILALGAENTYVTNGAAFAGRSDGIFPFPWTSVTAEQASNEIPEDARLELDIRAADADRAERLLYSLHGRAVTRF